MQTNNFFKNALMVTILTGPLGACAFISGHETLGEYADDAAITGKIKAAILEDPSLHTYEIHVETLQRVVQLSGFVDSHAQIRRAEDLARQVKGVKAVKNTLLIYPISSTRPLSMQHPHRHPRKTHR